MSIAYSSNKIPDDVKQLIDAAGRMDDGAAKVSLLEEAVRRADMTGDLRVQYDARQALIVAGAFGGRHDVSLVAFTWCLAANDANPGVFHESILLFEYKWIIGSMPDFPSISRTQIEQALDDIESRYQRAGLSMHPILTLRWKAARFMGDFETARILYRRLSRMKRQPMSDCEACVVQSKVDYFEKLGEYRRAIKAAERILAGELSCGHIPHATYATMLWPFFATGDLERAMHCHRVGYPLVQRNPSFVEEYGEHIRFLALTANHTKALQLISAHVATAWQHPSARDRFEFLRGALFEMLCQQSRGKTSIKMRVPPTVPFARPDGVYSVAALVDWFTTASREVATQLDVRNGNNYFHDRLRELPDLLSRIRPHAVKQPRSASAAPDAS